MNEPKRFRILVPTDLSECSHAALRRAVEEAKLRDGEVTLLHVIDLGAIPVERGDSYPQLNELSKALHLAAARRLEGERDGADPAGRWIRSPEVAHGRPEAIVLEQARTRAFDLIVMGTHGRTGLSYDYVGSIAERVIRGAPCDVLVVRGPGAR